MERLGASAQNRRLPIQFTHTHAKRHTNPQFTFNSPPQSNIHIYTFSQVTHTHTLSRSHPEEMNGKRNSDSFIRFSSLFIRSCAKGGFSLLSIRIVQRQFRKQIYVIAMKQEWEKKKMFRRVARAWQTATATGFHSTNLFFSLLLIHFRRLSSSSCALPSHVTRNKSESMPYRSMGL